MSTGRKKKFLAFDGEYFALIGKILANKKQIVLFFYDSFRFIFKQIYYFFYDRVALIKSARMDMRFAALNNFNLGQRMLKENKITDAMFRLHLANILRKNSPVILYNLAYVYFIKGNQSKAKAYLARCLDIRPNFANAQTLMAKIK